MPEFSDPRIQAIYEAGMRRIEELRRELRFDEAGILQLPFRCYGCDQVKANFSMMTGDGLPMCTDCIDSCVRAIPRGSGQCF